MKKDLVIAVLLTFCLTSMLFMVTRTSSSPDVGDYDPWLDYNDDGKIDMRDIGATCRAFMSSGNPTKNVSIENWLHTVSTDSLVLDTDLGPDEYYSFQIVTEGYRLINLQIARELDTTWDGRATVLDFLQNWGTIVEVIDFISPYPVVSDFLTYEITMNKIAIDFKNVGVETIPAGEVVVNYYMTT